MKISFSKYHGAGNDFVIIDSRNIQFPKETEVIKHLCDRHFGIGADGLMLLENSSSHDFYMRYFNSNGNESTMCGNGGRCITLFAHNIGLINESTNFMGVDGEHSSIIENDGLINLKMQDVKGIDKGENYYFLNTGSPHYVSFVDDVHRIDVAIEGKRIRHTFNSNNGGTNVNYVDITKNKINIRTFERGVEAETLACGTGSVASAIAYAVHFNDFKSEYLVKTLGGELRVRFNRVNELDFDNIWLKGPAVHVFDGQIII